MAPKETISFWGMHIFLSIRMAVMPAVMGSPPKWTTLGGTASSERTQELYNSSSLKRPV